MKRPLPFHSNLVWPPPVLVVLFIILYGMVAACFWLIELNVPNSDRPLSSIQEVVNIRTALLAGAAGVYAAYRLWRFHPVCNQAYAAWLKLSPWTANQPLPIGPIHLVWQDAVVVGVLMAIALWHAHMDPALPLVTFGLVYLGGLTLLLAFTRRWGSCLLLGFLWPALILPGIGGAVAVALVLTIIAVIWHGHRQSMKAFPWEFPTKARRPPGSILQTEIRLEGVTGASSAGTQYNLGWPMMALSPKVQPASVSLLTGISLSTLLGWWSFCVIERSTMEPAPEFILLFAIFAALIRVAVYCSGVMAPFNVWGRITSGRIIVPGYDKIYLTPLAVVLVAILGSIIIKRSGAWHPTAESCVIAVIWFVLFSGGPTLRNWALTGQHRLRPPTRLNASKQAMRSI